MRRSKPARVSADSARYTVAPPDGLPRRANSAMMSRADRGFFAAATARSTSARPPVARSPAARIAALEFCDTIRDVMLASLHATRALGAIFFAAVVFAGGAAGCVHRVEIRQGDIRVSENAEQVAAGMSADEVRELLGPPQAESPFRDGRWIYLYQRRNPGFLGRFGRFALRIDFENGAVKTVSLSEEGDTSELESWREMAEQAAAEKAQRDAEAEAAESESESGTDSESDPGAGSESGTESESDPEASLNSGTGSGVFPDSGAGSGVSPDSGTGSGVGPDSGTGGVGVGA